MKARFKNRLFAALVAAMAISLMAPASGLAGNWEWWGYRTNSSQTWALASQHPTIARRSLPGFNAAAYAMGWSWHWNAQSARRMNKCTGIAWSGSPVFVGCSRR